MSQLPEGAMLTSESLYDRIGGDYTINAAVDSFYVRVLGDALLKPFFEGICMDAQMSKMKIFLKAAFGGISSETVGHMGSVHKELVEEGLSDRHIDHIIIHMRDALDEIGVARNLIIEAIKIVDSYRDDVLGR